MSKVLSALPSAVGPASAAQFQNMSVYQVGSCRQGGMLGDGSPESRRARRWRPPPVLVLVDDREDGIFARLAFTTVNSPPAWDQPHSHRTYYAEPRYRYYILIFQ